MCITKIYNCCHDFFEFLSWKTKPNNEPEFTFNEIYAQIMER